uniref:Retrovirus-related Pol polyprotein from transposon 412 family n=1 Tax=Cajanus cajan TaxID=3821 RepID=A0A151UE88_CAJCA
MKFPGSDDKIIFVKANQKTARQCYAESLKISSTGKPGKKDPPAVAHITHVEITDLDSRSDSHDERPSPIDELDDLQIGKLPGQCTKISKQLSPELRQQLEAEILQNADLFAWSSADMPGIDADFICHRLAIHKEARPVAQRKRKVDGERQEAIVSETQKLLNAGFIREVRYTTWLANMVLVKKNSGKWRMCVDYTDLNKACPKDSYPLPSINRLVDGAFGHALLSFLDAYSGRVMPFGLKNAGATYQRLMDKGFHQQIGRNMEVYVDDMVVKTTSATDHVSDLAEIFAQIRRHNMHLNPEKCVFGVQRGRFLGFMITSRGIEANPEKYQCEEAFQGFKTFLTTRPILQRPDHNTDLLLCLAVAENAISPVIVQEHQKVQTPIYFINRVLEDAEKSDNEGLGWMTGIWNYLKDGTLPEGKDEARKVRMRSAKFVIIGDELFKRGVSTPLFKCLTASQAAYVIKEIHQGICGMHSGARSMATRVLRAGYYWPTLKSDCQSHI